MAVSIVVAVVGIVVSAVGIAQKGKAAQDARNAGVARLQQESSASDQYNKTQIEIGQGNDISNIISSVVSNSIKAKSEQQVAALNKQGNTLMIVGMGIIVLSLGILVLKPKSS